VFAEQPQITRAADRVLRGLGDVVLALVLAQRRAIQIPKQVVEFLVREPHKIQIEIHVVQRRQFGAQQILIPASVFGQLVVGDHQGAALGIAQMVENDHRNRVDPELLRRQQAAMPGNDDIVRTGQDRVGEAELGNGCGDLCYLLVRMRPRVPGVGHQLLDRRHLDLHWHLRCFLRPGHAPKERPGLRQARGVRQGGCRKVSGCGPADPKVRTRKNPLSLENYRAKPPRIHIGPRRTQGRGGWLASLCDLISLMA
jgi:hypothetical protein